MVFFWLGLVLLFVPPMLFAYGFWYLHCSICERYLEIIVRIFQEKPLFIVPRGEASPEAEDVAFDNKHGLSLRGCYFKADGQRRGVILFGLEFGSNRWSSWPYCEHLIQNGFDVFAFECRNQGDSDSMPDYDPLQWVTDYEVIDTRAALEYLKNRPDADPRGVGFFGISKGGGAGLYIACEDEYIRCCATDGVFGTYTTLVPYMRQWIRIYNKRHTIHAILPKWYFAHVGTLALKQIERERKCRFSHLEPKMPRLAPRPLLMMHGEADSYIKPEMAETLFRKANTQGTFWLVEGAKHNQALHIAGDEYRRRVLSFFEEHLADGSPSR